MRIALVTKRLAEHGGSERQLALLTRALLARGHEVHLFCRSVHAAPCEGVVVHRMSTPPVGETLLTLLFAFWARRAIARHEALHGPFHVRHAFGRTLGQDVYRLGGGCHRTYLEHAHALDRSWWWRRWLRRTPGERLRLMLEERVLGRLPAPHVITNSRMVADDLAFRFDLDDEQLHVVRNGVDLETFRLAAPGEAAVIRESWGLPPEASVLLFLGTGFSRKGLEWLLRALPALLRERPELRLVVAGRERHGGRYRRLARALGVDANVRWLGPVDDPERCYRGADLLVLPTAYDPAANVILEAMASGIPSVTTTMNGAAELLDGGALGTALDTPVVPGELAAAIRRWLDHGGSGALTKRLRARAEEHSDAANADAMLDVYEAVVQDRRAPIGATT